MVVHDSSKIGKSSSLPADRERRILDRFSQNGQVNATALADEFSTSEDTIRRDLRELAARPLPAHLWWCGGNFAGFYANRGAHGRIKQS